MILVRPSFEKEFNLQFKKIVSKLSKDAQAASNSVIQNVKVPKEQTETSSISLNRTEISLLEKEIRDLGKIDLKIMESSDMKLPKHVEEIEAEVGSFVIPQNSEVVHSKFVNLVNKPCVKLEDGSLYEGQWCQNETR